MGFAIVTGASRGIGRVLAERLGQQGHTVACLARSAPELEALAAANPRLLAVPVDLADPEALEQVTTELLTEHGPCSLLINNAGYGIRAAIEDVPIADWRHEFEVNLFAATRLIQRVLPGMREAGGGTIVNISSVAGRISPPFSGAYAATKFAMEAMSDALRVETRRFGVHVVLVEPGPVSTDFAAAAREASDEVLSDASSAYRAGYASFLANVSRMHRTAWTAEQVADATIRAIGRSRPPARVACYGTLLRTALGLHALSTWLFDRVIGRQSRADSPAA